MGCHARSGQLQLTHARAVTMSSYVKDTSVAKWSIGAISGSCDFVRSTDYQSA